MRGKRALTVRSDMGFQPRADLDATDPEWGRSEASGDGRAEAPDCNGSTLKPFEGSSQLSVG
ncbi:hypothetical protein GCM10009826_40580 [Humibacillus xanthopallidus]